MITKELPENNLRILFRVNMIKSVDSATDLCRLFGGISYRMIIHQLQWLILHLFLISQIPTWHNPLIIPIRQFLLRLALHTRFCPRKFLSCLRQPCQKKQNTCSHPLCDNFSYLVFPIDSHESNLLSFVI